jgi:predicted dehydrogenase
MAEGRVKVGIIGSQFQADIHAASLQIMPHEAEIVAATSPTPGNTAAVAEEIQHSACIYRLSEMPKERDIEMVRPGKPNSLARANDQRHRCGRHTVCEKPRHDRAEGEEMIARPTPQRG